MQDVILADKPAGISTHSPVEGDPSFGFAEHLEARLGRKVWVCHRLDKDTFGTIVFATSKQAAAKVSQAFEEGRVKKTYVFVSHRIPRTKGFTVESYITKQQGKFVSFEPRGDQTANAVTHFKLLKEQDGYTLWEARPDTGKPHQIRLHAQSAGIPVLGDKEHGGASFHTLMLQSSTLEAEIDGEKLSHTTPLSRLFGTLDLLKNKQLMKWLIAIDRRERYMRSFPDFGDTIRLIHTDGGKLRVEQLGEVISLQWFANEGEDLDEQDRLDVDGLIEIMGWKNWRLQIRWDRGKSPNENPEETSEPPPPVAWNAKEGVAAYEFRRDVSLSTGLFLDQRNNRRYIHSQAKDKKVLNLFCYTGGFSVMAALGGAAQTTSVDISKNFLEWTKRNFELNKISIASEDKASAQHSFYSMDAREFLNWAAKKGLTYDLIICDPPSFGRTKDSVFKIEKDIDELMFAAVRALAPGGVLLFSTNYEKWTNDSFMKVVKNLIREKRFPVIYGQPPTQDLDFEMPGEASILKSVLLSRSTPAQT